MGKASVKDLEEKEHPLNHHGFMAREMYERSMAQIASTEVKGQGNQQEQPKEADQNLPSFKP